MSTQTGTTAVTRSAGYTAVVHYPAPAGDVSARDLAAKEVLDSAEAHEGNLGSVVLRGGSATAPELYMVVSFDSQDSWQHWRSSEPGQRTIGRLDQATGTSPDGSFVTRLFRSWLYPQTNVGLMESTPTVRRGRADTTRGATRRP